MSKTITFLPPLPLKPETNSAQGGWGEGKALSHSQQFLSKIVLYEGGFLSKRKYTNVKNSCDVLKEPTAF